MDRYDSIIVGAGHNGLVCAAYLAKGGQHVLVLEASGSAGGLAATREFHPGFRASVAHSISHFPQKIAGDLNLTAHGFDTGARTMPTIGMSMDGTHVMFDDGELTGAGADDESALKEFSRLMHRCADILQPFWLKSIPRIGSSSLSDLMTFAHIGIGMRRLGKQDMREFLRIAALPARDLLDEYFTSDLVKATLSWDGLVGSKMAPRSPNSAVVAMLYRLAEAPRNGVAIPAGDVRRLIEALSASAIAAGAELRYGTAVDRVAIGASDDGLVAKGVQLSNGERIEAARVISAIDPKRTFLGLVGVEHLEIGFSNRIRRLRSDGYVAKLHLALSALPQFDSLERANGRMIIAPDMDAIEFAFDDAKYGDCPANPVMEIVVPSVFDRSLAPDGQHVMSAHVMYVPYRLKGGWNEQVRDQLHDRVIDTIARYAPRIREQIIHSELLTPADLEREYRVTGGHWHHADLAMDQMLMMRPTYEAAQYSTPIPGLFLCGAGCHPGGDLTGAAGHNAAHEILR